MLTLHPAPPREQRRKQYDDDDEVDSEHCQEGYDHSFAVLSVDM
jgi:hypothetical protein